MDRRTYMQMPLVERLACRKELVICTVCGLPKDASEKINTRVQGVSRVAREAQ